jgi:hypothetical protein
MNCWYCCRCDGALLAAILILGVGGAESVAGGVVLLMSGKWMVLGQKMDLPRRQTGYLWNAESEVYKMGMGWSAGSTVKRYENNLSSLNYRSWR